MEPLHAFVQLQVIHRLCCFVDVKEGMLLKPVALKTLWIIDYIFSINKYHSDYIKCDDPDQEDQGHKWSLSALLRHLKANNIDTVQLMQSIEDVIIKSIISVEFPVNR